MSQDQQQHLKKGGGGTNQKQSSFQIPQDGGMQSGIQPTTQILSTSTSSTTNAWENFPPNLFTQFHSKTAQKKIEKPSPLSLHEQMQPDDDHRDTKNHYAAGELQSKPRKGSIADYCDDEECDEEINNIEEEKGTRFSVNQKLIKNKNQFQDYSQIKGRMTIQQNQNMPVKNQRYIGQQNHYQMQDKDNVSQQYVMILDKRSRSETPNKMTTTDVFMRAHQKLQTRLRKSSPSKLLEKHQQKQKKAEEFRTQIEHSKKKWYEKIRLRQQIAKQRWKELLAERKRAFYDKLEQAEERRESEIEILRNKAKQELQKIDETNYIVKMTVNNMKLDINNKMTETLERRNQIMEENKRKHQDRHLKEEAAEKRRQELLKEQEIKISKQREKREQAEQRRNQMLEQKKRAAQEYQKRSKVLQRKNDLDKISDVMSFVNNSEFIWEFLGNEEELEEDEMILELIQKDQLEIQKYKLRRDAEILNNLIVTDELGNIYAQKQYLPYIQKMNKMRKRGHHQFNADSSSSNSSEDEFIHMPQFDLDEHQEENVHSPTNGSSGKHAMNQQTPKRLKMSISKEEEKSNECYSEMSNEKEDSIADESALRENSEEKSHNIMMHRGATNHSQELSSTQNSNVLANMLTDEAQNYMLYQIRMKMSMKRNILKKCLSEDLTWAQFLKEDQYLISQGGMMTSSGQFQNPLNANHARSLYSTPERRADTSQEEDPQIKDEVVTKINTAQSVVSTGGHHRSSRRKKGRSSGKHHHSTQNSFTGLNLGSQLQQTANNAGISSNTSDKQQQSRISSVVYPSTKKKNPKNEKVMMSTAPIHATLDIQQAMTTFKQKGGSNSSSTHSLLMLHQNAQAINHPAETPREGVIINVGNMNLSHGRKSLVLETDSGRKRQCNTARINHSSSNSQDLSSMSGVIPQNIFNTQLGNPNITTMMASMIDIDDKLFSDGQSNNMTHTGSQMTQLLANSRPIMKPSIPKKLTPNATKFLFPLQAQKLLLKRPGKDGQFGKFKVSLRIEELILQNNKVNEVSTSTAKLFSSSGTAVSNQTINAQEMLKQGDQIILKNNEDVINENEVHKDKSQVSTPVTYPRKDSLEIVNPRDSQQVSPSRQNESTNEMIAASSQAQTPSQLSKLLQIQLKFQEKIIQNQTYQQVEQISNLLKKKNALITSTDQQIMTNIVDSTPSPKKDISILKNVKLDDVIMPPNLIEQGNQQVLSSSLNSTTGSQIIQTPSLDTIKDQLLRQLLIDNIQAIKIEDTQKTICLESEDSNRLIDFLETQELQIRYCRLCELIIQDIVANETHVQSKAHKKNREDLQIKDMEDLSLSIVVIQSVPGDIEKELVKEKEKALKRKVKRIKAQMNSQAVNHESAASCPGKDFTSTNKKRCQILCIELEKQVLPIIKDYEALDQTLKEMIKILDMRKQADLHLMRKLKFIPILVEICKRIQFCQKNEFKNLGKALESVVRIINTLCGLRENRNYMLQTNRMGVLIDLLKWCLNRPTQLFYGINFIPQLFHILTTHVKHRAPYECQQMKELFIEYLISSEITMKIKAKFQIINGPLDLSEMMGQVPLFLLKSANFLEALTSLISMDAFNRPIYEKSEKIGEHVFFVIQHTEIFGIAQMIATILLTRNQPFKSTHSAQSHKILPQTILSLAITSIKIINHIFRMDYRFAQQIMSEYEIQEQLYHLFNYILFYTVETASDQEDSKELLHETILLVGYFCMNNEKNQALLCRGEKTIIHKLCGLPIAYFHDKKLKEILFPSLIQASYKNDRILAIMDQEISIEMLVSFLQTNIKEELPKIIEEENDYMSMSSMSHSALERRSHRSPSISSTNSSQCSMQVDMVNGNSPCVPLIMRFPKKLWRDAVTFYSKVLY